MSTEDDFASLPPAVVSTFDMIENGEIKFRAFIDRRDSDHTSHSCTMNAHRATAKNDTETLFSKNECATVFLKWDGCTHLGLGDKDMGYHWTHFDDEEDLELHLRMLRWLWETARDQITEWGA